MLLYSLEKIKAGIDGFYNLFQKTIRSSTDITITPFIVTDEFEGRLDLISKFLYGSADYIEELMVINNIINPYSIKSNTIIYFVENLSDFNFLYDSDPIENHQKDKILNMNKIKQNKNNKYPPTIKPDNLKQLKIDYKNKKIVVINKFN